MRRTKSLLPTDELNNLLTKTSSYSSDDEVLELLIYSYLEGVESGSMDASKEFTPDIEDVMAVVYRPIAGKTFEERLTEYRKEENEEGWKRVIETETHRTYVEGQLQVAKALGLKKTWVTMLDDKVRDSHVFLEGVTVDADEKFYTEGDSALAPGLFEQAENNVNCRCELFLS